MSSLKAKCDLCKRRVDIGSFTGTYSLHNNKSGLVCPGSSKEIPKEFIPHVKLSTPKTRSKRKTRKQTVPSASLIAQFEVNQKITVQQSIKEEREIRKAALEEHSSSSSVRSVNAGLPTLGRR
jgi:hypothetical protein